MKMRPFGRLLAAETARERLLRAVRPVRRTEEVPLVESVGRVAALSYSAPSPVPAFARATWDGYALRSSSTRAARSKTPVRLRLVGEVHAEDALGRSVAAEEAVAIATGGAMPAGTDSVIIFEEVRTVGGELLVPRPVRVGEHVAEPGDDFEKGDRLVGAGEELTPAALGALAATGRTEVDVFARPVVSVIPNGNELVAPGGRLGPGQIHETNNVTLGALVAAAGGIPRLVPPVIDDPDAIERAIRAAIPESDLVLVTGGSSVGDHDYLPAIFPRIGRLLFHGIAVRPGKPTLAAAAGPKLVIGMPGHPTSCLSNGFWLLLPVLRRLGHRSGPGWVDMTLRMAEPYRVPTAGLSTVVPLHIEGGSGTPTFRDSSAITSLSAANGFVFLPPGRSQLRRGERVLAHLLPFPISAPANP
ncbi:MAG: molybdopterin molybdotransferase MoeA [Thermoplasmata archaeon]|nr:molybdopterin molybdotransferase MoeA [Thermoplasmata archaeon]